MKNIVDLYNYTVEKGLKEHSEYLIRFINDEIFQKDQLHPDYFLEQKRLYLHKVLHMFRCNIIFWLNLRREIRDNL